MFLYIIRCNYINFRRNAVCLKCDHKRQKASNVTPVSKTAADCQNGVTKTLSFVEEEGEQKEEEDGFMRFPVEGGRSNISKSAEKREQWKLEMAERIRSNGTEAKKDDDTKKKNEKESRCYDRRRNELLGNISDDGEMDDWFISKQDRSA